MDVAEEPGQLHGKGGTEMGVDALGTVRDGPICRDEIGASGYLPKEGCRGSPETVQELLRLRAGDAASNRVNALTYGPYRPYSRKAFRENSGAMDSKANLSFQGLTRENVVDFEAKSPWYRSVEYLSTIPYFVAEKIILPC